MSIFYLLPFPGSIIYDMLLKEGKIKPEDDGHGISYISMNPMFEANDWSREYLLRITKAAYRRFYFSPKRIFLNLVSLHRAFANPFVPLMMLFKLMFYGSPVHERN
jgi:hypothetical protein